MGPGKVGISTQLLGDKADSLHCVFSCLCCEEIFECPLAQLVFSGCRQLICPAHSAPDHTFPLASLSVISAFSILLIQQSYASPPPVPSILCILITIYHCLLFFLLFLFTLIRHLEEGNFPGRQLTEIDLASLSEQGPRSYLHIFLIRNEKVLMIL